MRPSSQKRPEHARTLPALRFDTLTRLYDPLVSLLLNDRSLKQRLADQVDVRAGQRALDLGCGTGTFLRILAEREPRAALEGLDADERVLAIARRKLAGLPIRLHCERADRAHLEENAYDHIVSSLFFHHLMTEDKRTVLSRCLAWMRPGGALHVLDWGPSASRLLRAAFLPVRILDGFARTEDNVRGRLPALFEAAGFVDAAEQGRTATVFGSLSFYRARKPLRERMDANR